MALVDTLNGTLRKLPTWPFYVIGLAVPLWYLYLGFTGGLGVEPIKELEHRLGLLGLQVLAAGLLVTPLRRFAGLSLLRFRRMRSLQKFVAVHASVFNHFNAERSFYSRANFKKIRAAALAEWRGLCTA